MKYPFLTSKAVSLTRRKIFLFSLYTLFAYTLTGCGKEDELENYKANMNQFFENVRVFDASINAIENPESDQALEVPDCFPGVEELADDASMYMSEAVSYYHMAYEGGGFDASLEDVAMQNYAFANTRLQYIISILHGDIPEEIFTYEDEETPDE